MNTKCCFNGCYVNSNIHMQIPSECLIEIELITLNTREYEQNKDSIIAPLELHHDWTAYRKGSIEFLYLLAS